MNNTDKCKFDGSRISDNYCCILTEKKCEDCKFRKTEEEFREAQQRSKERLIRLNDEQLERLRESF